MSHTDTSGYGRHNNATFGRMLLPYKAQAASSARLPVLQVGGHLIAEQRLRQVL